VGDGQPPAGQRIDHLRAALKAYHRAAVAPERQQAGCADLHYNKAIVQQYLLEYRGCLASFAEAQRLGPELNASAQRHAMLHFVRKVAEAIRMRGHLPKKRLQQLQRRLRSPEHAPGGAAGELKEANAASLSHGPNPGVHLTGAVVAELVPEAKTPLCYVVVDASGEAILVCAYNTSPAAVQVYQTITVLAPVRRTVELPMTNDAARGGGGGGTAAGNVPISFECIVVEDPVTSLLVQGKSLEASAVERARVTRSAPAEPGTA